MPVELIVGAAVGAAVVSAEVRKVVRKGVIYGLAGGLIAYDKVSAFATGLARGVRDGVAKARQPEADSTAKPAETECAAPQPTPAAQGSAAT